MLSVFFFFSGWKTFLERSSLKWRNHIYSWLVKFKGPTHVVFYGHLHIHLLEELVKLCGFLRTNSTLSEIWCTAQDQEGMFHREKPEWLVTSSLFTDHMKAAVHKQIDTLYKLITNHDLLYEARENFDILYRNHSVDSN